MKIDKFNIKEFLSKYNLGLLNDEEYQNLHLFLKENPDFLECEIHLNKIKFYYPKKDKIKKPDEYVFIKYIEGDLISEQQEKFLKTVEKDVILLKELKLFEKTKLITDFDIRYPHKKQLKSIPFFYYVHLFRAAAVLVILFFLIIVFDSLVNNKYKTPDVSKSGKYTDNFSDKRNNLVVKSTSTYTYSDIFLMEKNNKPHYAIQNKNQEKIVKKTSVSVINSNEHPIISSKLDNIPITDVSQTGIDNEKDPVFNSIDYVTEMKNFLAEQNNYNDCYTIRFHSLESIPLEEDSLVSNIARPVFKNIEQFLSQYFKESSICLARIFGKKNLD